VADFTSFTIEKEVDLGYYPARLFDRNRTITIPVEGTPNSDVIFTPTVNTNPPEDTNPSESLETAIVNTLDFPNEEEFDALFKRNDSLREQGLQTLEDVPDITRRVKLRITVEVLDD